MRAAQQRQIAIERDTQPRDVVRHGNDNLRRGSVEELVQSRSRTWQLFARGLMAGGLLFALILIAVLAFVYSGYP